MTSLKALKSIFLTFSLDSKCAGLGLMRQFGGNKMVATNPSCKVSYKVQGDVSLVCKCLSSHSRVVCIMVVFVLSCMLHCCYHSW